jgi:PAP2 superfamily
MPSLHAAWALLIWFNCKPFSRFIRALAFAFVVITVFDTLGTGEHYLIDLVAAFPFAIAVQALCTRQLPLRSPARLRPLAGGFALTLTWPFLLRYATGIFLLTPAIPWACLVASLSLSVLWMKTILGYEENARGTAPRPMAKAAAAASVAGG